jgi:hypothetical protein
MFTLRALNAQIVLYVFTDDHLSFSPDIGTKYRYQHTRVYAYCEYHYKRHEKYNTYWVGTTSRYSGLVSHVVVTYVE